MNAGDDVMECRIWGGKRHWAQGTTECDCVSDPGEAITVGKGGQEGGE